MADTFLDMAADSLVPVLYGTHSRLLLLYRLLSRVTFGFQKLPAEEFAYFCKNNCRNMQVSQVFLQN